MLEIWKPAYKLDGIAEVSNLARIRTLDRMCVGIKSNKLNYQMKKGKILNPWLAQNGYLTVAIKFNGSRKKYNIHRLVAFAFVDGYFDNATVNHINGIKTDNRPENLEWITLAKNTEYQWRDGLVNLRGENHPSHILSEDDVKQIRELLKSNLTYRKIGNMFGVGDSIIYRIKHGKVWKHI